MAKCSVMAAVVCALASASAEDAPQVSLSVGSPFATEVTVKHYRKGQDLLHETQYFADPFNAPAWRAQWVDTVAVDNI